MFARRRAVAGPDIRAGIRPTAGSIF